jgi:hypothetical protein
VLCLADGAVTHSLLLLASRSSAPPEATTTANAGADAAWLLLGAGRVGCEGGRRFPYGWRLTEDVVRANSAKASGMTMPRGYLSEPAVKDAIGSEAVATVGASRGAERCAGASTVKVLVRMLCFMVDRRNHRSEGLSALPRSHSLPIQSKCLTIPQSQNYITPSWSHGSGRGLKMSL